MTDTTPPNLTSLTFPTTVDLSAGNKAVKFSATGTDDSSGIDEVVVWFDKSIAQDIGRFSLVGLFGSSDTWADGASSDTRTFLSANAPGVYAVDHVTITDLAGNAHDYTPAQLQSLGAPTSITLVGSVADTTPPNLTSLTFPTTVDLSAGNKAVKFSATGTDDSSGIDEVVVWFDKSIAQDIGRFSLVGLFGSSDTWADGASSDTRTFLSANAPGVYAVDHVTITDLAGNARTYTPTQLQALGAPTSIIVTAGGPVINSNGGGDTAALSIGENTTAVTTVSAIESGAATTLAYSISGGADAALFQINALTGALSFKTAPNFEQATDADHNNSYIVQIRASDNSLFDDQTITISVTNVNEPPAISSNGGRDTAAISIPENSTAITTVSASDPDAGTPLAYSISGGADAALFQINASTGALSFKAAPDFEQPMDADHNNSYIVQVRASDGSLSDDQAITVNVIDVAEPPHWIATSDIGSHPVGWLPVSAGDFNHDGTNDVLWYNSTTNDVDLWKIQNGQWAGSVDIGSHPAGWQLIASADFDHDQTPDLLWYNPTSGDAEIWKIQNGQWAGSIDIGLHPPGWRTLGSGDFNGDGTGDVLWYNASSNDLDIWKISNGQWAGSVDVGSHPAGWQPIASGDFDHDGTSDILWYNSATRDIDLWKISNGQWAGSIDIGTHPAGYAPAGIRDFNGDGTPDILWFNAATGDTDLWLIANGHWSASVDLGTHPAGWTPAGVGDFNGDHVSDILWRDAAGTHVEAWLLSTS
jgi:hypothetical protein